MPELCFSSGMVQSRQYEYQLHCGGGRSGEDNTIQRLWQPTPVRNAPRDNARRVSMLWNSSRDATPNVIAPIGYRQQAGQAHAEAIWHQANTWMQPPLCVVELTPTYSAAAPFQKHPTPMQSCPGAVFKSIAQNNVPRAPISAFVKSTQAPRSARAAEFQLHQHPPRCTYLS